MRGNIKSVAGVCEVKGVFKEGQQIKGSRLKISVQHQAKMEKHPEQNGDVNE
jgi:hypothetical protein